VVENLMIEASARFSERTACALSLKQPWAALLVYGHKSIEVRRWRTPHRGPVLIHAARVPDLRPEAWALVPDEIYVAAQTGGGIVGVGVLTQCLAYDTPQRFALDQARHLNPPSWFREPTLYGFVFTEVRRLPFRPYPGSVRFFAVEERLPEGKRHGPRRRAPGLFDHLL
jgi:ASCH domain